MGESTRGKRPVAPEGVDVEQTGMTVYEAPQEQPSGRNTRPRHLMGLVWCSIGSAFSISAPVLANVLIAFGAAVAMLDGERRECIVTLLVTVVTGCVAASMLVGVYEIPAALISVLSAYVLARWVVLGHLDTNRIVVTTAAVMALMLGTDTITTSMHDTSPAKVFATAMDNMVEQSIDSLDLTETAALLESKDSIMAYWPTMYFVVAAGMVACSVMGARLGVRTSRLAPPQRRFQRFDVPLWVALLFAAGVVVELVTPFLPAWQDEVAMVGANVVMCTRLVLMLQGLAVLQWLMGNKGVARPLQTFVIVVAVWLELSFALTSVVGLMDVGFNFRHVERKRPDIAFGPARER